ncbi:hypothetical protein [Gordonia westfalica]
MRDVGEFGCSRTDTEHQHSVVAGSAATADPIGVECPDEAVGTG